MVILQKQRHRFSKFNKTDDTAHIPRGYRKFITYISEVFGGEQGKSLKWFQNLKAKGTGRRVAWELTVVGGGAGFSCAARDLYG